MMRRVSSVSMTPSSQGRASPQADARQLGAGQAPVPAGGEVAERVGRVLEQLLVRQAVQRPRGKRRSIAASVTPDGARRIALCAARTVARRPARQGR